MQAASGAPLLQQPGAQPAADSGAALQAVTYEAGQAVDTAFCQRLQQCLHKASWTGVSATQQVLPAAALSALVQQATRVLAKEPTLVEVRHVDNRDASINTRWHQAWRCVHARKRTRHAFRPAPFTRARMLGSLSAR